MTRTLPDHPVHWDDGEPPRHAPAPPADPWTVLRAHTPARIALGRAGTSLPTAEVLRFAAAHAAARDAVHLPLAVEALVTDLGAQGLAPIRVESRATSRVEYLTRPDLGRQLAPSSREALEALRLGGGGSCDCAQDDRPMNAQDDAAWHAHDDAPLHTHDDAPLHAHDDTPPEAASLNGHPARSRRIHPSRGANPQDGAVCIVIADGLSAIAAQRHAAQLVAELAQAGVTPRHVVVATQARVALGDEIGECVGAEMVVVLIGERPGLSSPDSLGAYLTWAPRAGRADSERNCVSNIRPEGLALAAAAGRIAWLVREAQRRRVTGIALKDDSEVPALAADAPPGLPAT